MTEPTQSPYGPGELVWENTEGGGEFLTVENLFNLHQYLREGESVEISGDGRTITIERHHFTDTYRLVDTGAAA